MTNPSKGNKGHGGTHIVIPDTQVRPGVPLDHLNWVGQYIAEKFAGRPNVTIVHLGDHWDMSSLSSYDKGKKAMEGRRISDDIIAGNLGFQMIDGPIKAVSRNDYRKTIWRPRKVLLRGNHEDRITRAIESDAQLEGVLSIHDLQAPGWEIVDFLQPILLDGITYAHYFYNPMSGNPYSGMIETRLKNIGRSFTQGHQQGLMYGMRPTLGGFDQGLVAGSCYIHDEDYKGPQGNAHWRGIVVCHEVHDGMYDPMFVSLNFLCIKYEGMPLSAYTPRIYL